jgi:hypothetical protein
MKNFLLSTIALLALSASAQAQATGNGYATNCGNCVILTTSSGCCATYSIDDTTLASWAAKKAVESQQSAWWDEKKVKDLTREEVDARAAKLTALKAWAKGLSNHIFADAYCNWVDMRSADLAGRRQSLDQLDVALSLVKGLPTPPNDK